jgi:hypothetical protein
MSPIAVSDVMSACIFGGAIIAKFIKGASPEHHLSPDAKDTVELGMGLGAISSAPLHDALSLLGK